MHETDTIRGTYGGHYDDPERCILMNSPANQNGMLVGHPIMSYPFYEYLLPARNKSQPESLDQWIPWGSSDGRSTIHELPGTTGILVRPTLSP
ncbi:hypothetical protein ACTXT7_017500 [Hymenolepis weldensis]